MITIHRKDGAQLVYDNASDARIVGNTVVLTGATMWWNEGGKLIPLYTRIVAIVDMEQIERMDVDESTGQRLAVEH